MDEDLPIKQMVAANLATLDPACDSPPKPDEPLNVTLGRRMKYPGDLGYAKFLWAYETIEIGLVSWPLGL